MPFAQGRSDEIGTNESGAAGHKNLQFSAPLHFACDLSRKYIPFSAETHILAYPLISSKYFSSFPQKYCRLNSFVLPVRGQGTALPCHTLIYRINSSLLLNR